jgi:hypothetical protein
MNLAVDELMVPTDSDSSARGDGDGSEDSDNGSYFQLDPLDGPMDAHFDAERKAYRSRRRKWKVC